MLTKQLKPMDGVMAFALCVFIIFYVVDYNIITSITIFKAITVFCRTDIIMQNIPHIQIECKEYFVEHTLKCGIFFTFNLNVRPHNIVSPA